MDLARLARIEGNVVNKFPEFNSFEEFGYGSFLKFLSSHEELQEAIEQVGGLGRSEGKGKRLGYPVPLGSVLDFVSQYGTQSSHVSEMCVRFREICLNIYCAFQNVLWISPNLPRFSSMAHEIEALLFAVNRFWKETLWTLDYISQTPVEMCENKLGIVRLSVLRSTLLTPLGVPLEDLK